MKYGLAKKICYSAIVLVLLVGLILTAIFGMNGKGYGSVEDISLGLDLAGGVSITYEIQDEDYTTQDVEDTIYKLQQRAESYSTESNVYREGDDRVTVEIPTGENSEEDANEILAALGTPGSLEFLDSDNYSLFTQGSEYETLLTGNDVENAQAYTDTTDTDSSTPYGVQLTFTDEGAEKFYNATSENVGSYIYILFDGEVVSAPTVNSAISGGTAVINGIESYEAAENLATYIRVGSVPVTLEEVSSSIVSPQLGASAIKSSMVAAVIGLVLLCIFMIVIYRLPGVVATLTLSIYTTLVLFLLSVYDLTLTLPGIAGIILGIGMAVDGNVIIYTRIREEIAAGKSVESSILAGYSKAASAIIDGNVTTLIAGIVLYIFGTGSVKGFATTLMISNIVSVFTSLVITKIIMKLLYNFGCKSPVLYGKTVHKKTVNFLGFRIKAFIIALVVIVAGFVCMGVRSGMGDGAFNYSLEFVGGTTTTFEFAQEYDTETIESDIIPVIKDATGVTEVQQQKTQDSTAVAFKTTALTQEQREAMEEAVVASFPIEDGSTVESNSITGSVSSTMRRNAILSVVLATVFMLIYIFIRFKDLKFALAAVIALVHDVLVVLAFYAFTRITVGTTFIACMLTIVGYSINGTIIIFDRIREQLKTANSKTDITELVNSSITYTFTRTVNTTITTLIMLVCLAILGVSSVKEFAMPLIAGILAGTFSSVLITSALWYIMGGKKRGVVNEVKKEDKKKVFEDGAQV
ncbi:MAG: protein translocase subunit SecD [Lachnospira sp.]|nr:protein translocase subunit SecD [Lachnospira sp.]